ncbi:hypothetical protein ES703_120607 [subsurface metagenome]
MSLKLAARLVALEPNKIADLQENDDTEHTLDISTFVPPECMCIIIAPKRISGAGLFMVYPRSHATIVFNTNRDAFNLVTIKNQELKWKNSVANDDWDLHLLGYFVQRRTR